MVLSKTFVDIPDIFATKDGGLLGLFVCLFNLLKCVILSTVLRYSYVWTLIYIIKIIVSLGSFGHVLLKLESYGNRTEVQFHTYA